MERYSGRSEDKFFFNFRNSPGGPTIRLEWHKDDKLQLFPQDVVRSLINRNWARRPSKAAMAWYEELLGPQAQAAETPSETSSAPAPAEGGEGNPEESAPETKSPKT